MLPGVPDATEGLERVAAHHALAVVAGCLRHGDGRGPGRRVLVDGGHREVAQGAGPLDGEEHVAHLVLHRLERADRHPELLAVLHVRQDHLEERVGDTHRLERQSERRLLDGAGHAERGRGTARLPRARSSGTSTRSSLALQRGRLASSERTGARPASAAGTTKAPTPSPARATTATSAVPAGATSPSLVPSRTQPPSARSAVMVTSPSDHPRGVVGHRHGPGDGTGGQLREKALALVGRADLPDHRGELGERGEQGPGGDGAAQLLDDDGGLDDGEAEATVLLGNRQRRPVERDHGAPQALGRFAALDDGTDQFERALLVEERTDGRAQLLLLAREFELHRPPFPAVPVCRFDPRSRLPQAGRSGRVYLTTVSASLVLPSRRTVFWEAMEGCTRGGRRSGMQARTGETGARIVVVEPSLPGREVRSPTLSGAPLAQRQSNGLLIRRFRVQIPRGALHGLDPVGATGLVRVGS